jgi:hypothetical protein
MGGSRFVGRGAAHLTRAQDTRRCSQRDEAYASVREKYERHCDAPSRWSILV